MVLSCTTGEELLMKEKNIHLPGSTRYVTVGSHLFVPLCGNVKETVQRNFVQESLSYHVSLKLCPSGQQEGKELNNYLLFTPLTKM